MPPALVKELDPFEMDVELHCAEQQQWTPPLFEG